MWGVVFVSLLLRLNSVYGENSAADSGKYETEMVISDELQHRGGNSSEEVIAKKAEEKIFDKMWAFAGEDWSETEAKSSSYLKELNEEGRGGKLKYKKTGLHFFLKILLTLKLILGILVPLGIVSAKILSWKAVTFSLMAFMLAKILLVKNLLSGKTIFSATPTNFIPPVVIQSGPNEAFWKRQGDLQPIQPWNSS